MNKILLWLLMLPASLWRSMGADTDQLRAILDAKLKIDDRKPLTFGRKRKRKNGKFGSVLNMFMYAFMGFIYIFPLVTFHDKIFALFGYFTVFLFLLTFSLITDFSNILTDTKDKLILIPRPINDETLVLSRFLHACIYLFRMVIPMSLAGWIILGIDNGWKAAVVFPIPLLLMVFMSLFFVNACYLLILKFAKAERFQDVINSFQIAFSVIVVIFYYGLQGASTSVVFKNLDPMQYSWIRFTPPYWLASCFTWAGLHASLPYSAWLSLPAVIVPLFCFWLTIKVLSPTFTKKLAAIDGVEVRSISPEKAKAGKKDTYKILANIFNTGDAAKAGFMITWLQTTRSRTFKTRVYPSLVLIPVYFFYLLWMRQEPFADVWRELPNTKQYLTLLYMSAFALLQAMNYVNISDQYKAAWVYYSSPVDKPGNVMIGAFKALWIKYYLPFITLIGLFVMSVWGGEYILDVLLATVNVSMFALSIMRLSNRAFPFSIMEQMKNTGGKAVIRILSTFLLIGFLGLGHYLATYFWWLKVLFLVLSSIFFWLVWDSYMNTDWNSLRIAEENK